MLKIATLSFDDGHPKDKDVAETLRRLKVSATFYIIGERLGSLDVGWYKGHEIGSHTMTHRHPWDYQSTTETIEIYNAKYAIASWCDQEVLCFSYPYGQATTWMAELVSEDFSYARTFAIDPENAYFIPDPVLVPITAYFDDAWQFLVGKQSDAEKPIHIAGHGYHFDTREKLDKLRWTVQALKGKGYEFVTNYDFFDRCLAERKRTRG